MLSSLSDVPSFREICRQAAEDPDSFAGFRENPAYSGVVSTTIANEARDFCEVLKRRGFDFDFFDRIRDVDRVGGTRLVDYPDAGAVAPQTMRYVKALSDIERLFPRLEGQSVVEIGGGFGGQCALLSRRCRPARYLLVDLPEPLMLARRYLECLGIANVAFATPGELSPTARYDLVISAYALSEIARPFQLDYVERVLKRAAAGYLLWNSAYMKSLEDLWHRPVYGCGQIHADEMLSLLPDARFLDSDWLVDGECAMTWGIAS